jgi:hypothetical protein
MKTRTVQTTDEEYEAERARDARIAYTFDRMNTAHRRYMHDDSPYPVETEEAWRYWSYEWLKAAGVEMAHRSRTDCHPNFREGTFAN